jgi:hypothetical protein
MFPLFVSGQVISYGNKAVAVGNKVATYTPVSSATPFSPSDLDSLVLWLKADAGVTKDGSNYVSSWADQSGNGNNATQATGQISSLRLPYIAKTFTVANNKLDETALNTLFGDLKDLTNGTAQTITITGNPGAGTCDQTIATNKNWIVVN